jgi:hypothetical protein
LFQLLGQLLYRTNPILDVEKKKIVTLEAKNRSKGLKFPLIPQVFLASTPSLLQSPSLKVMKTLQTRTGWN